MNNEKLERYEGREMNSGRSSKESIFSELKLKVSTVEQYVARYLTITYNIKNSKRGYISPKKPVKTIIP